MNRPALSKQLFAATRPPDRFYGLVDPAGDPDLRAALLHTDRDSCVPLLPGDLGLALAEQGPHLQAFKQDAASRQLIDRHGERWLFLWSEAGAAELCDHFLGLLLVDAASLGHALHFRIYDPVVFAVVAPTCDRPQLERLIGPVSSYRCVNTASASIETYSLRKSGLVMRREKLAHETARR